MSASVQPLRVALNQLGGAQWTGGLTYRNNLLKALALRPGAAEVVVIGEGSVADGAGRVVRARPEGKGLRRRAEGAVRRLFKRDPVLARTLQGIEVDVVFPAAVAARPGMAPIYWIPDFQYRHLPHLYTDAQRKGYDTRLARYFEDATLVVVSSRDAERDLKTFFPAFADKARVLSFVAHVPDHLYDHDPAAVAAQYHLPESFFYLPNQFWAHKNHGLVLEAIQRLKQRGVEPFVVCTGNPVDVRAPLHLADLLRQMSELGVRDNVALLGMTPHAHVYALMRQSKALLNPSLFEGWSTSVEEAKSVGKRVLASGIGVHREQDAPGAVYFEPTSSAELADAMERLWHEQPAGPDLAREAAARAALPGRMEAFADAFLAIGREAVERVR